MASLRLRVKVPFASFRKPYAREYLETYDVPPFSTIYGMLLSLVGEENRLVHVGAALAIGIVRPAEKSRVLRTARRWKSRDITASDNARPDYQEVLSGVDILVLLNNGEEKVRHKSGRSLADRVAEALASPGAVDRFGGLSLGESRDLVDTIYSDTKTRPMAWILPEGSPGRLCTPFEGSDLVLPIWVDHVGSARTRFQNCRAVQIDYDPEPTWWTTIKAP